MKKMILNPKKAYIETNEYRQITDDFTLHIDGILVTIGPSESIHFHRKMVFKSKIEDFIERDFQTIYELNLNEANLLLLKWIKYEPIYFEEINKTLIYGNPPKPVDFDFNGARRAIYQTASSDYNHFMVMKYREYDQLFSRTNLWTKQPEELNGIKDLPSYLEAVIQYLKTLQIDFSPELTEFHHKKMIRYMESDLNEMRKEVLKNG